MTAQNAAVPSSSFSASDTAVAIEPAGEGVWIALSNGAIEIRNSSTGALIHYIEPPRNQCNATRPWCLQYVTDSSNAGRMWIGLSTGAIEVRDCHNYNTIWHLRKHISGVYCIICEGNRVFTGSSDFTICQWNANDGQLVRAYAGHSNYVRCLYVEGLRLISGSEDETIRIWNSSDGSCDRVLSHHKRGGGVQALCRVGVTMWSGDTSGVVARWSLVGTNECLSIQKLHNCRVSSIELIVSQVIVSYVDGTLFFMHSSTGETLKQSSTGSKMSVMRCVNKIDRFYFWSGSTDQTIRCWNHDEAHLPSPEYTRYKDMLHFYSHQLPYRTKNKEAIAQIQSSKELCMLTELNEKGLQDLLAKRGIDSFCRAPQAYLLAHQLHWTRGQISDADEELATLTQQHTEKERSLLALEEKLRGLEAAVTALQSTSPETVSKVLNWAHTGIL